MGARYPWSATPCGGIVTTDHAPLGPTPQSIDTDQLRPMIKLCTAARRTMTEAFAHSAFGHWTIASYHTEKAWRNLLALRRMYFKIYHQSSGVHRALLFAYWNDLNCAYMYIERATAFAAIAAQRDNPALPQEARWCRELPLEEFLSNSPERVGYSAEVASWKLDRLIEFLETLPTTVSSIPVGKAAESSVPPLMLMWVMRVTAYLLPTRERSVWIEERISDLAFISRRRSRWYYTLQMTRAALTQAFTLRRRSPRRRSV